MGRKYILDGATLMCTMGTSEGKIKVTSQRKVYIQSKLKVTDQDKTLMPNFTSCKRSSPPPPCLPSLQEWQKTGRKVTMGDKTFVMEDSRIQCSHGGMITVKDDLQKAGGEGLETLQLRETIPLMNG